MSEEFHLGFKGSEGSRVGFFTCFTGSQTSDMGLDQADAQVGLPFPELTGPSRKEECVSPSVDDLRLLNQEAQ